MEKYIPYVGLAVGILSLLFAHLKTKSPADISARLSVIEKQVALFWSIVEKQMSAVLHSPHRKELDKLLDKNSSGERLTQVEATELVNLIQKLIDSGELSTDEKTGAIMMMAAVASKYKLYE